MKNAFRFNSISVDVASDGFYTDTHTVSSTLAERLQSDLGACGDDLRNIYFCLGCFVSELDDVTEQTVAYFLTHYVPSVFGVALKYLQ